MDLHIRYIKHSKGVYSLQYKKRKKWKDFKELHGSYVGSIWSIYYGKKKKCLKKYLDQVNVRNIEVFKHPTIKVVNPQ